MIGSIDPTWLVVASFGLALSSMGLGLVTSYVKISVVFGMLRNGLGTQQVPGNIVVMSLSLALTSYVMAPVMEKTFEYAESLNLETIGSRIDSETIRSLVPLITPWRQFLLAHAGQREIHTLLRLKPERSDTVEPLAIPLRVLIPAFILTELKEAFSMGFALLLPFLVIDLVVANVLVGMGMSMVSPVMISLPLKLLLFVLADGWLLLSQGLIQSYGGIGV